ncbi:MAG: hypothetical protein HFJ09_08950 [Lachnospiraceae bacterium]|nr:hypothetical protein [Lachnospiraceae bacterium]
MAEERSLLVGVDLCEDYSQITCFSMVTYEPESICQNGNVEKYRIPTALFYKSDTAEWFFGEDAIERHTNQKGFLIKNIIEKVSRKDLVEIEGHKVEPVLLLERYLKRLLGMLKPEYPSKTIRKLVVTVREKNMILINHIYQALQNLGISKVRASVQNHEQCFVSYALNQPKELRVNDIVLFDFDNRGLMFYQITINRRTVPHTVVMKRKSFLDTLNYEILLDDTTKENVSYIFENIVRNVLHKQLITAIYVTGSGFEGKWCRDVLKEFCVGRRVFLGQNLYAKGAGYAARELAGEGRSGEYLYLGEETVTVNISMPLFTNQRTVEYQLIKAGTAWFNASKTIQFIPDGEFEIELIVENVAEHRVERHLISMDGLYQLSRKTRIELSVEFMDIKTCVVTLRDKGFGDLFPSSNRIWEKILNIQTKM